MPGLSATPLKKHQQLRTKHAIFVDQFDLFENGWIHLDPSSPGKLQGLQGLIAHRDLLAHGTPQDIGTECLRRGA